MVRPRSFNPKRRLAPPPPSDTEWARLRRLADSVSYSGNPEHKRSPGDFGLEPPVAPRPSKTLCNLANVSERATALHHLREGLRRGMVSEREVDGWPQNVWAVTDDGVALEAQRDRAGSYHGYPMPSTDPFRAEILRRWGRE
jgi:hypothetical protein